MMFFLAGSALVPGSEVLWKVGERPLMGLWFSYFLGPPNLKRPRVELHTLTP